VAQGPGRDVCEACRRTLDANFVRAVEVFRHETPDGIHETDGFVVKLHAACFDAHRDRYRAVSDDD
jgi:hypothetical protein